MIIFCYLIIPLLHAFTALIEYRRWLVGASNLSHLEVSHVMRAEWASSFDFIHIFPCFFSSKDVINSLLLQFDLAGKGFIEVVIVGTCHAAEP